MILHSPPVRSMSHHSFPVSNTPIYSFSISYMILHCPLVRNTSCHNFPVSNSPIHSFPISNDTQQFSNQKYVTPSSPVRNTPIHSFPISYMILQSGPQRLMSPIVLQSDTKVSSKKHVTPKCSSKKTSPVRDTLPHNRYHKSDMLVYGCLVRNRFLVKRKKRDATVIKFGGASPQFLSFLFLIGFMLEVRLQTVTWRAPILTICVFLCLSANRNTRTLGSL